MHRASAKGALAGLLALLALTSTSALAGGLSPNPANDPRLVDKPIEDFRYDEATRCKDGVPRGTKALQRWLEGNVRGETWGIKRCERWGPGSASLHAESRAIDWHLDARRAKDKRAAMKLIRTLLAPDRKDNDAALARRMGVQGLIFNCKSWWSGAGGLDRYSYCFKPNGEKRANLNPTEAHIDHVHIELNRPGARKRTSFWKSPLG